MLCGCQFFNKIFLGCLFFLLGGCSSSHEAINNARNQKITWDKETLPVVIVGGGVAGLMAAVYLTQAAIPTVVLEGQKPGGALAQSHSVRNWPGICDAPGAQLVESLKEQAIKGGAQVLAAMATAFNFDQVPFTIEVESLVNGSHHQTLKTLSCIIAMGREPNYLGVLGERGDHGYWGRGVSDCAVCDGRLYKNLDVVVIGGGDAAVQETEYLAGIAKKVTLLVRKDAFRAKDIKARDAVLAKPNVKVLFNVDVKEIQGDGVQVTDVVIHNNKTKINSVLPTAGVFLAIGARPNTALLKGKIELDEHGYVVLKEGRETSVPGVYAAGDIAESGFAQAVSAFDAGARAANQVKKRLDALGYVSFESVK